jgi:hypothetical protein
MFNIIGADGKQYGPVSADQIRQWFAEGRANNQSMVQAPGTTEWRPLASLPEFFALSVPPPSVLPAQNSPLALAGFICSIISVTIGLCCCYGLPFNLVGIGLSIAGLVQVRNQPERFQGRGLAITGLILGILSILLGVLLLLLGVALSWSDIEKELRTL